MSKPAQRRMLPCTPRSLKVIVTTNVLGDSKSRSASNTFPSWWLGNFKDGKTKNAGNKSYIGDFKHSMLSMWWFWHVSATSPFFAGKSTQYWFILLANASEICYKRGINSYLSKHHVTSVPWHSSISQSFSTMTSCWHQSFESPQGPRQDVRKVSCPWHGGWRGWSAGRGLRGSGWHLASMGREGLSTAQNLS